MTVAFIPNFPVLKAAADFAGNLGVKTYVELAVEEARRIAPVDTGTFRDSIEGIVTGGHGLVGSPLRYAVYLEFGTSDTPIFATFRRSVEVVQI